MHRCEGGYGNSRPSASARAYWVLLAGLSFLMCIKTRRACARVWGHGGHRARATIAHRQAGAGYLHRIGLVLIEGLIMGVLVMFVAAGLSLLAGVLKWHWALFIVCAFAWVIGYVMHKPRLLQILSGRGDMLSTMSTLIIGQGLVCAALFGLGRFLGGLWG